MNSFIKKSDVVLLLLRIFSDFNGNTWNDLINLLLEGFISHEFNMKEK